MTSTWYTVYLGNELTGHPVVEGPFHPMEVTVK